MSNNHGGVRDGSGRPRSEPTKLVRVPVGAVDLVKKVIEHYKLTQPEYVKK